jgi:hypothetical protein
MQQLAYTVRTFRAHGLEAKWGKVRGGTPAIFARDPQAKLKHQRGVWWYVDAALWKEAQRIGLREAFDRATVLGDLFSVRA